MEENKSMHAQMHTRCPDKILVTTKPCSLHPQTRSHGPACASGWTNRSSIFAQHGRQRRTDRSFEQLWGTGTTYSRTAPLLVKKSTWLVDQGKQSLFPHIQSFQKRFKLAEPNGFLALKKKQTETVAVQYMIVAKVV
jgi:hypothetical protein